MTKPDEEKTTLITESDTYVNRPFNIRPLCFWAFFVVLTIVVCLWSNSVGEWIVGVWLVSLIGLFFVLQRTKSQDAVVAFLRTSRLFYVVTIGLAITVVVAFSLTNIAYTTQKSFQKVGKVTGTVESYHVRDDMTGYIVLSSVKMGKDRVNGNVQVYFENLDETQTQKLVTTHRISFVTKLNNAGANDYNINNRIKYTSNMRGGEITTLGESKELRHIITRYSKKFLGKVLNGNTLELMYSMLFGDRSNLDGELNESFQATGMAHVLAVSGLHVGLIVGLLLSVLKLMKLDRKRQFPIIAVVLFFYCYLCGFRYSIIRASIMFLVFLANRLYFRSSDFLSSISAAAIIILIIFPYSLLSVSFQFSFACMLGIALFQQPMVNFIKRFIKYPKFLSDGIAIYLATTVICLPLMLEYFGYISTVGLIANVLFMPILILCFQICVVALTTYLTWTLLYISSLLLNICLPIISWLGDIPFSRVYIQGSGYFFIFYFLGLILLTRFVFTKRKYKYTAAALMMGVYVLSLFFAQ